jgi:hypothetical protein
MLVCSGHKGEGSSKCNQSTNTYQTLNRGVGQELNDNIYVGFLMPLCPGQSTANQTTNYMQHQTQQFNASINCCSFTMYFCQKLNDNIYVGLLRPWPGALRRVRRLWPWQSDPIDRCIRICIYIYIYIHIYIYIYNYTSQYQPITTN